MPRLHDVTERAAHQLSLQQNRRCSVPGCGRLTQKAAGDGLSERLCRVHQLHLARHGSAWRRTYDAAELRPYVRSAKHWLRQHRHTPIVAKTVEALGGVMASAGQARSAYDLRGLPAAERALIALARLREASVTPEALLLTTLALSAAVEDLGPASHEFMIVSIGKALHRKASGTHRTTSGLPMRSKYPRSSGRVLRILGQTVWDIAAVAADEQAIREVLNIAQPETDIAKQKARERVAAEELVAREILRVSSWGWGTDRLAAYRRQLRWQHGLK